MRIALLTSIFILLQFCSWAQCNADFSYDATSLDVTFLNESTFEDGEIVVNLLWEYGDGGQSTNGNPSHTYSTPGEYEVTLSFTTSLNCFSTISKTIYICDLQMNIEVDDNCDDGYIDLDISISDEFENGLPANLFINDQPYDNNPITDLSPIALALRADGSNYEIKLVSSDHNSCTASHTISAPSCVLPCLLNNLEISMANATTYQVDVTETGFEPNSLNIRTGDYVNFNFLADNRSTTNIDETNQSWDSGILNTGDNYQLYSYDPGIYRYYSSHNTNGEFEATLVSSCGDSLDFMLDLSFTNTGQPGPYQLFVDSVPFGEIQTYVNGQNNILVPIRGDGLNHEYIIESLIDPTCRLTGTWKSPICGETEACNVHVTAIETGICDNDSLVNVTINVLSTGTEGSNFNLLIDNELYQENIAYTGKETLIDVVLKGDGNAHIITVIDNMNSSCADSYIIELQDCASPCQINNMEAGIGSTNVYLVNVENDQFNPSDITISAGDRVLWQWITDTMRSVTAVDFSFDSGVRSEGYAYTSDYLPVGVHRYFSEFTGMMGSITVQPNCTDGKVPAYYAFDKSGGAQNGYDVYFDTTKINNQTLSYAAEGFNTSSFEIDGDGLEHTITIKDQLDSNCIASSTFISPACDQSVCAIFLGEPINPTCNGFNNIEMSVPVFSYNVDTTFFNIYVDGHLNSTPGVYHSEGETSIDLLIPGDGQMHEIIIRDSKEFNCADTMYYDAELCTLPCDIYNLDIAYQKETATDSCLDGEVKLDISINAIPNYQSRLIVTMTSDSMDNRVDTFAYPAFEAISLTYAYLADGRTISITAQDELDQTCSIDTSFNIIECLPDPCAITITDIEYSECRDSGYMDMTIEIDTFRVADSMRLVLDSVEIYRGSYADFAGNNTFEIQWNGEERELLTEDLDVAPCNTPYDFFTQFCPVTCNIQSQYSLVDTCILATDTSYTIAINASVLNAASDSVLIEVLGSAYLDSIYTSYDSLANTFLLEIPVEVTDPSVALYDIADESCRSFLSIDSPTCILDCSISISNIDIIQKDSDTILITNTGLEPLVLHAQLGDTIVFYNSSNISHSIFSIGEQMPNSFSSELIAPGAFYEYIPQELGDLSYTSSSLSLPDGTPIYGTITISHDCYDGLATADVHLDYNYPYGDNIIVNVDGSESTIPYPEDNIVRIQVTGLGDEIDLSIYDAINNACQTDIVIQAPECTYTCLDLVANYSFVMDTLNRKISFFDQSTGETDNWQWTFGDGQASVLKNPEHTFDAPGTYTVCVDIQKEAENCFDKYCQEINIPDVNCKAEIEISIDGLAFTFESVSSAFAEINAYTWTLDDVIINDNSNSGSYQVPSSGTYELCLEISTVTGCDDKTCMTLELKELCDIVVDFSYEQLEDSVTFYQEIEGTYTGFLWTIDGSFALEDTVQRRFPANGIYEVCLIAENTDIPDACKDTLCELIEIDVCRANATFLYDVRLDTLEAEILAPLDSNDTVVWDFGDGFSSTLHPITYLYSAEGDYTICATLTDPDYEDCTDTHCEEINITFTSVEDLLQSQSSVYPNPIIKGSDIVVITAFEADKIEVLAADGQLVMSYNKPSRNSIISTQGLSAGSYSVRIIVGNNTVTKKVIIVQ